MEAFSLLKYWKGGATTCILPSSTPPCTRSSTATTIVTAVSDEDDDGPFFDLEFSLPQEEETETKEEDEEREESVNDSDNVLVESILSECDEELLEEEEEESELRFTLSSSPGDSSTDSTDQPTLPLSPSDDLFFKGKLLPIINDPNENLNSNSSAKPPPQLSISFLKSATKLKVFNLGLKKSSKLLLTEGNGVGSVPASTPKHESEESKKESSKFFMVKFKVDDVVNIASLFNSSSRSSSGKQKPVTTTISTTATAGSTDDTPGCNNEDKMFSKEAVQKYLKKVKPLYIRVSKRYGDKLKFPSGALVSLSSGVNKPAERRTVKGGGADVIEKDGLTNLQAGIKVACKRLGKSRSASSVAASAVAPAVPGHVQSSRRDDSLLQHEDGIQGAILHCKRSFNAS